MRIPCSAKTLLRLHRKFFTLRTPRKSSRSAYSLSFSPDGKAPLVRLRVEKQRPAMLGVALSAAALTVALMTMLSGER